MLPCARARSLSLPRKKLKSLKKPYKTIELALLAWERQLQVLFHFAFNSHTNPHKMRPRGSIMRPSRKLPGGIRTHIHWAPQAPQQTAPRPPPVPISPPPALSDLGRGVASAGRVQQGNHGPPHPVTLGASAGCVQRETTGRRPLATGFRDWDQGPSGGGTLPSPPESRAQQLTLPGVEKTP